MGLWLMLRDLLHPCPMLTVYWYYQPISHQLDFYRKRTVHFNGLNITFCEMASWVQHNVHYNTYLYNVSTTTHCPLYSMSATTHETLSSCSHRCILLVHPFPSTLRLAPFRNRFHATYLLLNRSNGLLLTWSPHSPSGTTGGGGWPGSNRPSPQ